MNPEVKKEPLVIYLLQTEDGEHRYFQSLGSAEKAETLWLQAYAEGSPFSPEEVKAGLGSQIHKIEVEP